MWTYLLRMFCVCYPVLPHRFQQFPPGHYFDSKTKEFTRYYNPKFYLDFEAQPPITPSTPYDPTVRHNRASAIGCNRQTPEGCSRPLPLGEAGKHQKGAAGLCSWVKQANTIGVQQAPSIGCNRQTP